VSQIQGLDTWVYLDIICFLNREIGFDGYMNTVFFGIQFLTIGIGLVNAAFNTTLDNAAGRFFYWY
jgi:hypothetical protein